MAKQNQQNQNLSPEEKARLEEEALNAEIAKEEAAKAEAEAKAKADAEAKTAEEAKAKEEANSYSQSPEEKADLDEQIEHKIKILKTTPHLKEGNEHVVSGNIANILIKRGLAELVEIMPEKSKINP
jgi:membrane protein involved in colicin uptake